MLDTTTVGIIVVAAMAWLVTVQQSRSMTGMANGLGQFGQRMPNDMGLLGVLAMWPPMMVDQPAPPARARSRPRDEAVDLGQVGVPGPGSQRLP